MNKYDPAIDDFSQSLNNYLVGLASKEMVLANLNRLSAQDLFSVSVDNQQTRLFYLITQCKYYMLDINNFIDLIKQTLHRASTAYPFISNRFKNGVQWMLHSPDIYNYTAVTYAQRFKLIPVLNESLNGLPTFIKHHTEEGVVHNYLRADDFLRFLNSKTSREVIKQLQYYNHNQCSNFFHNLSILLHNRLISRDKLHELFTVRNIEGYRLLEVLMAPDQHPNNIYVALCFLVYARRNDLISIVTYQEALFFTHSPRHCLMHMFALQYPRQNVLDEALGFNLYLQIIIEAQDLNLINPGQALQLFLNKNSHERTASAQLINSRDFNVASCFINFLSQNPLYFSDDSMFLVLDTCMRSKSKNNSGCVNSWIKSKRLELSRSIEANVVSPPKIVIYPESDPANERMPSSSFVSLSIFSPNSSAQETQINFSDLSRSESIDEFLCEELGKMSASG